MVGDATQLMKTPEEEILDRVAGFRHDALGFVLWAFPWGEGELAGSDGPSEWQRDILIDVSKRVARGAAFSEVIRIAVASGHGIGKSCLVAWILVWAMITFPGTRGVVTANTENQLKTKTWVEISKWCRLFVASHMLNIQATTLFSTDKVIGKEWRIDIVPWSEKNTEAFAGLHNEKKRIVLVFDEASAIPDIIWETAEGAMTDKETEILWAVFGNPTKTSGRFRQCFPGGRFAHRWASKHIDSRTVPITNKKQIQEWIDDHGIDSDFVRVRVLGLFPRVDSESMISYELALEAAEREIPQQRANEPVVLGVDVARQGDDLSVIFPRRGLDARSLPVVTYSGADTMELATLVARTARELNAVLICVDGTGVGGGVVDRLRQLGLFVVDVQFGSKPQSTNYLNPGEHYANRRTEIAATGRDWLKAGGCIPRQCQHVDFIEEISSPKKSNRLGDQAVILEPKEITKKELGRSTDFFDAWCCTLAEPVIHYLADVATGAGPQQEGEHEYDPFDQERIYA